MDILSIVLYGVIQGLTEFLPVSSSGHLALLPKALSFKDPGVTFDLAMHVGTALAVLVYFRKEVFALLNELINLVTGKDGEQRGFLINMILSTVVTVVLALVIKDTASDWGRNPTIIGVNLLLFGLFLGLADLRDQDQSYKMTGKKIKWKEALLFGLFQAMAVFPGVSRSGSTILFGRLLKMTREEASRYSFLMSLPIILGGFIFKLGSDGSMNFSWSDCFFGVVISFITGIVTIHFFLKFIKKMSLWIFTGYRIVLAILVWIYL